MQTNIRCCATVRATPPYHPYIIRGIEVVSREGVSRSGLGSLWDLKRRPAAALLLPQVAHPHQD